MILRPSYTCLMSTDGQSAQKEELLFDADLRPHRSLSPRGFLILMACVCAVSFIAGTSFYLIGHWPVPIFFGIDVLVIYWAFRMNYKAARAYENVELRQTALTVRKVDAKGRTKVWRFDPYWVQVNIDAEPDWESPLTVSSHGRQLELGRFLTPPERLDFAQALRRALSNLKSPILNP